MPRDGDPMSQSPDTYGPDLFGRTCIAPTAPPAAVPVKAPPPLDRTGRRGILLSASNPGGGGVLLSFTPARGGIHFWRSLSPQRTRLHFVTTFPGRFSPLAVARLLASGVVRPAVEQELLEEVEVDGVDERSATLLKLAWSRVQGKLDPRVAKVVHLRLDELAVADDRMGASDVDGLLELGSYLIESDGAWLARWRARVDAEVDRRATVEGAGEEERRALRAFVEECLLVLGRFPRPNETEASWDGASLRDVSPGPRGRQRLRLTRCRRVRRYGIRIHFWSGIDTCGYSDFGPGPGWYWLVQNPNPTWISSDPMGPYETPEEAWENARCVGEGEE